MKPMIVRHLAAGLLAASLALGALVSPANALTDDEAGEVTRLLNELYPSAGSFAFDEEEADASYDRDQDQDRLIEKAGFDRDSWRRVLGETFRGYLALMPDDAFTGRFKQMTDRLKANTTLTPEQKQEMQAMVDEQWAEIATLREEGKEFADTVRRYADLLHVMMGEDAGN
ncbi:hypothetical protein ASC75_03415 [Aminobacter sp. DSM 101952]|uniref:hypothetical protein n=1 Tax=Aminobacter sp. DSM 101952 TaxID=2735891 RepID=UPI0006F78083|nr:hypothetical protein [Aminobacter sp. DSM 101952]KQU76668.1 hypothetical protein ASC75_03415 [Aminobacter sp. DSM 101952]